MGPSVTQSEGIAALISEVEAQYPGHHTAISHLTTLFTTHAPGFVFLHDPLTPKITSQVTVAILSAIKASNLTAPLTFSHVNALECFTPRLLFDKVINTLAEWTPSWENGCENWVTESDQRYNESMDAFVHGILTVRRKLREEMAPTSSDPDTRGEFKIFLFVERAERLASSLLAPLTRLTDLTNIPITTIFLSDVRWEDFRPSFGACPDPFLITIPTPTQQETLESLMSAFPVREDTAAIHPFNPSLRPLYMHFSEALYGICSPFTRDPQELAYIAAARWPGFIEPLLTDWRAEGGDGPFQLPAEDARIRLIRLFTPSFTAALEQLYPRLTSARKWCIDNSPPEDLQLSLSSRTKLEPIKASSAAQVAIEGLTRQAKFLLVAAYLASVNPSRSDLRYFGRTTDEKTRRRRKMGPKKVTAGVANKIPQRLAGPSPFPLDRLLAIFGSLLEEHAALPDDNSGSVSEDEASRAQVFTTISELVSKRLLHRTTASEKLDGPPMLRCNISYDGALGLAKELGVPLVDLLWDPA